MNVYKVLVLLAVVAWSPMSLAQDADSVDLGATVFPITDVHSVRFPDVTVTGPLFLANQSVTVLYVEADRLRVRKGDRYGWVPREEVTTEAPVTDAPALGSPSFDLEGIDLQALLNNQ